MKHSHIAGLLLLTGFLVGCTDNGPGHSSSQTEDYVRQFVQDFGVPADGHDFSMATTSGLSVKTSKPTHIIVSAEIDGDEYEFANLCAPVGTTPLPVTIPSNVDRLNIWIGLDKYSVGVNETVDLDRIGASRGYEFSSTGETFSVTETGNPILAIKYSDFLEDYFTAFPVGVDNTITYQTGTNAAMKQSAITAEKINGKNFFFCETILCDAETGQDAEYDIFPIYWRQTENGKNHSLRLSVSRNYRVTHDIDFGSTSASIPFPKIGYSTSVSSVDDIDFNNLTGFTYDDGSFTEAFTPGNPDMVIVSEGIRISVPHKQNLKGMAFDLVTHASGKDLISSSSPYNNLFLWGEDVYYQTSLTNLATCRGASKRTFLDKAYLRTDVKGLTTTAGLEARYYGPITVHNPDGTTEKRNCKKTPFLLGFTTPPSKSEDTDVVRDYANALFLVVPVTKKIDSTTDEYYIHIGEVSAPLFKKYYWVVAAEDLGGSYDWDFNDAVFAFTDEIVDINTKNTANEKTVLWGPPNAVPVRQINVMPLAAGGTLPIYITFTGKVFKMSAINVPAGGTQSFTEANETLRAALNKAEVADGTWVLGTELHKWLEQDTHTLQYNTGENRINFNTGNKLCQIAVPTDIRPADYETAKFPVNNQMSTDNKPLLGFGVLVDRDDKLQIYAPNEYKNGYYMEALPDYQLGKGTYLIGRPDQDKGNIAPQMIVVPAGYYDNNTKQFSDPNISSWKVNWEWPRECVSIKEAYPDFERWVANPNFDWTRNRDKSKVTQL